MLPPKLNRQLQYHRTLRHLHQLHRIAFRDLRQVLRPTLTNKQYHDADGSLGTVAREMNSELQFLVEIQSCAREQGPKRVIFEVSLLCPNCTVAPDELQDHAEDEFPPLDPDHYAELDDLLELTQRISQQSGSLSRRHKPLPGALTAGRKRFTDALVKERRHFRETAAAQRTTIEWLDHGPVCRVCKQPVTIPAADGPDK
jgi:hypothetical protein